VHTDSDINGLWLRPPAALGISSTKRADVWGRQRRMRRAPSYTGYVNLLEAGL
jgi:hypothetical protein